MIAVLNADEMRAADRRTIEGGVAGAVLMENAGGAVARALLARFPEKRRVVVLCGKGNNGGDGFVVANDLSERKPKVVLLARRDQLRGDAALQAAAYERSGGTFVELPDEKSWREAQPLAGCDLIVDALLGTGLREAPSGVIAAAIDAVREARRARGAIVVAVDLPSGLSSDGGALRWRAIEADLTVTFAAPKWGHVLPPACDGVGELLVADIGIPDAVLRESGPRLFLLEAGDAAAAYPPRRAESHKGDYGHVLVVAGSLGKTGAAVLAGTAALRAGAGLVTVATAAAVQPLVAAARPELMTEPLPARGDTLSAESLERALELAEARDAVVLGPGLGQGQEVSEFVCEFLARCSRPVVVDADGLNALAGSSLRSLPRKAATLLTPHPGEMARLLGVGTAAVQSERVESARKLAQATGGVVVLKGQRTLVAEPSGRTAVNPTGNPGMATGGTGDVLSGVAGALLARHGDAWLAACAAVYVHGRAGDLAARERGQEALIAGDLNDALGAAIQSVQRGDEQPGIARL